MRRLAKTMDVTATRVHMFVSEQVWPQLQLAVFLLGELHGLVSSAGSDLSRILGLRVRSHSIRCSEPWLLRKLQHARHQASVQWGMQPSGSLLQQKAVVASSSRPVRLACSRAHIFSPR